MTAYTLIRSRRYSLSLQVKPGGELVVRAPYLYPTYLINRFVESKAPWITKRLKEASKQSQASPRFVSDLVLQDMVQQHVEHYSTLMRVRPKAIRFKVVRTYWGSCSPSGIISFNLKLAYTTPEIVEYVVVHELAHLKWREHGKRFWDMVVKFYPNTQRVKHALHSLPRSI